MEYTTFGKTGVRVSKLGLGGAPLGGDYGPVTDEQVTEVIDQALELGINFIDTAPLYGRGESERRIGKALHGKRDQVFLASKAVMRGEPYTYDNTIRSVEDSLKRLGTDYLDLIQMHELSDSNSEIGMKETIPAFLKLKEQGKVRAIGVNAFNPSLLLPFIRSGHIDSVQTFCRYMLIDYSAMDELLPTAREHGVSVINGSVLGMGLLAEAPAPFMNQDSPMFTEAQRRIQEIAFLRKSEPKGLIEPAMRFSLSSPDITVTLTGTTSLRSLALNASYSDGVGLPQDELDRLLTLFPGQPITW
ncbi:aldo/keto reductase [Paenibacillus alginolyticus]|uniref:Aldo/keto reductase n=1 Tax=Paenibacillus alginolyticus TaxID=59839 RepID=A0ABT4GI62_9BACL|nr:aldo/keto reductase [Paenibacillus alginolyticus]MCY9667178.1 aldo/keto reductase [Paenibacillus alginolyticus]MCY9695887.1 aldo/keto reductase [Paenibacillus alginolyticus]MEC0141762.1 aldo/keto reductase [Paenibacillus alginolyticus]